MEFHNCSKPLWADGTFYYSKLTGGTSARSYPLTLAPLACGQDFKVRIYDTTVPPRSSISKSTLDQDDSEGEFERHGMTSRRRPDLHYDDDRSVLKEIKSVQGRTNYSRWTITVRLPLPSLFRRLKHNLQDANLSPLNDSLIYSSIGPVVSFVRTKEGEHLDTMSTDPSDHTQLNFAAGTRADFGVCLFF